MAQSKTKPQPKSPQPLDPAQKLAAQVKAQTAAIQASGLTIGDLVPNPAGGYVVPGFSTDAQGNIVTQQTQAATQSAAAGVQAAAGGGAIPDWFQTFWGGLGLDTATSNGLRQVLSGIVDPTQAQLLGEQYLHTTDWFKNTFPGYDQGLKAGLFTDTTGYRGYVNQLNSATQQYLGRAVSTGEVTQALGAGDNPSLYANRLQGNALATTLAPEAQYEAGAFTAEGRLSQPELQAYGQEKAGVDTPLGQAITQRLQQAQQRMATLFQGALATPNLSLGPQGLFSPSLQGNKGTPDIGA